jgi:hypothetical protein
LLLLASTKDLELALHSNTASLECSHRAAVAAPSGLAAALTVTTFSPAVAAWAAPDVVGVTSAKEAAVLKTASLLAGVDVTAACMAAAGAATSGVGSASLAAANIAAVHAAAEGLTAAVWTALGAASVAAASIDTAHVPAAGLAAASWAALGAAAPPAASSLLFSTYCSSLLLSFSPSLLVWWAFPAMLTMAREVGGRHCCCC